MWTERYRPTDLSQLKGQERVKAVIAKHYKNKDLPHFLFHGSPGTGKTSTVHALLSMIYGDEYKKYTLMLNASHERGIKVVREKIKGWASRSSSHTQFVILDEADSLTPDAQSALRRIMEMAPTTKFFLLCNYLGCIIQPIQSRCCRFKFEPLNSDEMKSIFERIRVDEKLTFEDGFIDLLIQEVKGDARAGVSTLQNLFAMFGPSLTISHLETFFDHISPTLIENLADSLFITHSLSSAKKAWKVIECRGYNPLTVFDSLAVYISEKPELFPKELLFSIFESQRAVHQGSVPKIQILCLLN